MFLLGQQFYHSTDQTIGIGEGKSHSNWVKHFVSGTLGLTNIYYQKHIWSIQHKY